jgi:hypothetical protein
MNEATAEDIDTKFSKFMEVDVRDVGNIVGECLRVKGRLKIVDTLMGFCCFTCDEEITWHNFDF